MRILVVEDHKRMAALLRDVLEDACYVVDVASTGGQAEELMATEEYGLVVLDWQIPAPSGLELLRTWRGEKRELPILMLTARGEVRFRVDCLDAGADDYLPKPFSVAELLARVRSLLRRREKPLRTELCVGDVHMNRPKRQVKVNEQLVQLTPKEFALLEFLLTRVDEVVSRAQIESHVWDSAYDSPGNVVDVTIHRLRKKIDGSRKERLLHTVRGAGFVLRSARL